MSALLPGTALGPYVIEDELGHGGFATVYRANDARFGGAVAIKVLAAHLATDEEAVERFIAEARALRSVDNDSVVTVFDISSTADGRPYMVLQYADRDTLLQRLLDAKPATDAEMRELVSFFGRALGALHDRQMVHRDVKPSNVLITSGPRGEERFVLGDLGLVKDLSAGQVITRGAGSLAYAAPEQRSIVSRVDARVDLYAASAVLAEAAVGRVRLPTESWDDLLRALPAERQALGAALRRSLAEDPNERPTNVDVWSTDLASVLGSSSQASAKSQGRADRADDTASDRTAVQRHRITAGLLALAAVFAVAGIGAWLVSGNDDADDVSVATVAREVPTAPPVNQTEAIDLSVSAVVVSDDAVDPSSGDSVGAASGVGGVVDDADVESGAASASDGQEATVTSDAATDESPPSGDAPDEPSEDVTTADSADQSGTPAASEDDASGAAASESLAIAATATATPVAPAEAQPASAVSEPTAEPTALVVATATPRPVPTPTPVRPTPTPPRPMPTATSDEVAAPSTPGSDCADPDRGVAEGLAPAGLVVTDVTDTTITIDWATDGAPSSIFVNGRYFDNGPISASRFVIEGQASGTTHEIVVAKHNVLPQFGALVCATTLAAAPGRIPLGLTMATGLVVTDITATSVTLSWNAASSGGSYLMHRGQQVAGQRFPQVRVPEGGRVGPSTTTYTFTDLDASTDVVGVRTVQDGEQSGLAWIAVSLPPG